MKSIYQFSLSALLACGVALNCLPSYADWRQSQHETNRANQDSRDAYRAQVHANQSARKGHSLSARLHSHHAAHERQRAAKHRLRAKQARWHR